MENITNLASRIKQFIEYKQVSLNKFSISVGASNSYFNKIIKDNISVGSDKIENILRTYPELSAEWLLTGKGPMLKSDSVQLLDGNRKTKDALVLKQEIPLYDLEATAGLKELFSSGSKTIALDTIRIPNLPKCDGAVSVTGDSMYPLLKSGDIVLYKETSVEDIFYGEMYLLSVIHEWDEYVTVKYIQKSEKGDEYVKLVSQNQHHQPKDVLISKISAIAMIKASIRINTMM